MVACASGASVKSGLDPDTMVTVDRSTWERVTGAASSWWDFLLDALVPTSIKLSDLCALNPDDPTLPAPANIGAAIGGIPQYLGELVEYFRAKMLYAAFSRGCVCNSPGAFSCTLLLTHPYTLTTVGGDCATYGFGVEFVPSADVWCYGGYLRVRTVGTGLVQHGVVESGGASLSYLETVVPTTSDAIYAFATPQRLLAGHTYKYFYQFTGSGWFAGYTSVSTTPTTTAYATYNLHVYKSPLSAAWTTHGAVTTAPDPIFCAPPGQPPMPDIPSQPAEVELPAAWSCTTIGDLCTRLSQVNQKLDWLRLQVALDSSRSDPYSYIASTAHSGLTGSGTLTVSDILGLLVELTTVPSTWGRAGGTPSRYIPAPGTIQTGTVDGYADGEFIHYAEQLLMPVSGLTTRVAYNFRGGIVATITELLRSD